MNQANEYLFGASLSEGERLLGQAKRIEEYSRWLLHQLDLPPGSAAVDVGCGPIGILNLLAEEVGVHGRVVGVDQSQLMLDLAQRSVTALGLSNVQLVQAAAQATGLPSATFAFAHARLLLDTTTEPVRMLAELIRLVRPGGIIAVQEVDCISWLCEPPHPAWDRLLGVFHQVWHGDANLGRRLPNLLRAQGLYDVNFKIHSGAQTAKLTLTEFIGGPLRAPILAGKLLTEEELTTLVEVLQYHLNKPATIVIGPLHVQAWGHTSASV